MYQDKSEVTAGLCGREQLKCKTWRGEGRVFQSTHFTPDLGDAWRARASPVHGDVLELGQCPAVGAFCPCWFWHVGLAARHRAAGALSGVPRVAVTLLLWGQVLSSGQVPPHLLCCHSLAQLLCSPPGRGKGEASAKSLGRGAAV